MDAERFRELQDEIVRQGLLRPPAANIHVGDRLTITASGNVMRPGGGEVGWGGGGGSSFSYSAAGGSGGGGASAAHLEAPERQAHMIQASRRAAIELACEASVIDGKRGVLIEEDGLAHFKVRLSDQVPFGEIHTYKKPGFAQLAAEQERPERIDWSKF